MRYWYVRLAGAERFLLPFWGRETFVTYTSSDGISKEEIWEVCGRATSLLLMPEQTQIS